jgi:hypothetical protein
MNQLRAELTSTTQLHHFYNAAPTDLVPLTFVNVNENSKKNPRGTSRLELGTELWRCSLKKIRLLADLAPQHLMVNGAWR